MAEQVIYGFRITRVGDVKAGYQYEIFDTVGKRKVGKFRSPDEAKRWVYSAISRGVKAMAEVLPLGFWPYPSQAKKPKSNPHRRRLLPRDKKSRFRKRC